MIRYLRHHQLDKAQWDACIEASEEGVLCALSWYLDIVSPGWHALVEEENGRYLTVMPLPGSSKMGFSRLGPSYYCQQLGIMSVKPGGADAVAAAFLAETTRHFRFIHNYKFVTENTQALLQLRPQYQLQPRHTRYLLLDKPYAELYRGYNRDRKMNLKRAKRAGLVIAESEDIEPMISFFKEHVEHKVVGGVAEPTYQMLRDIFAKMREHRMGQLFYSSIDGKLNAGCLFANYKGTVSYTFNAADEVGRVTNGRTLMLDEVIRQYASSGFTFDFESPAIEQIDQFYASFGAKQVQYLALHQNKLPLPVRLIRDLRMKLYRALKPNRGVAEEE
ncbi:GNAT family N-acetyltransferase [Pontibacter qinzhouensis]|uniref:GNAT family N-acetyltransferase n=1 Tax=Pontibacter qinzhouensis TaxID=2603253 RepID=A0A5C8KD17_9BACT|nr:GNAT family N-acetyltransferase [Pontibacter qinzhouensis]TXK52804.1 GNAT family N-acetyltransferase [Pontibacter qinzhouensis]